LPAVNIRSPSPQIHVARVPYFALLAGTTEGKVSTTGDIRTAEPSRQTTAKFKYQNYLSIRDRLVPRTERVLLRSATQMVSANTDTAR
jgi:hypothetical protein